ncbi:MAG: hypothetical protein C0467_32580 [Planctomycetaceae bacterium]|nr:hypothetical protein [Planctomycetaceae bacterium]
MPSPGRLNLVGSVIGIALCALILLGWRQHLPSDTSSVQIDLAPFGSWGAVAVPAILLLVGAVFFLARIAMHELIHAIACPGFGLSDAAVLGVWPSRLIPYADYQGPMPCWRGTIVAIAPFTILSLLPLAMASSGASVPTFCVVVSVVNALVCGGDALIGFMVLSQVPLRAVVQNKQWGMWWRSAGSP